MYWSFLFYQGKPILIALFIDWVKNGNNPEKLVDFNTQVVFEQALITKVQGFFPDNHAVLLAAHFYQRFNSEILAFLLDQYLRQTDKVGF